MALRRTALGALLLTALFVIAGCGGSDVLPRSGGLAGAATTTTADPAATATDTLSPGIVPDVPTSGAASGAPGTTTDGPPFTVSGTVLIYDRTGADVFLRFAACQRAALQHAADTLDPSFDPTPLCEQKAGTACTGKGDYARIATRAPVTVRDAAGRDVAVIALGRGRLSGQLRLSGPRVACAFRFRSTRVPGGSPMYTASVGPAPQVSFTQVRAVGVRITLDD